MTNNLISIISPVYNEEEVISEFVQCLIAVCEKLDNYRYEIILVNDGSTDNTKEKLNKLNTEHLVTVIENIHNIGQQEAILAGLRASGGNIAIVLDSDLQDPPEYIPTLIKKWETGADVVMCKRQKRRDNLFKKITADIFYWFINMLDNNLPVECGDFYLLDKKIVQKILEINRKNLYLRGLVARISYNKAIIPIARDARRLGTSSFTLKKMLILAKNGLFYAFSNDEK